MTIKSVRNSKLSKKLGKRTKSLSAILSSNINTERKKVAASFMRDGDDE